MQYKLPTSTTLGRSPNCDIHVDPKHTKVSREHAQIKIYQNSMYVLYDKSAGGTFVNGKREQQIVLHDGDRISLAGAVEFSFANGILSSSTPGVWATPATLPPLPVPPPARPIPETPPAQHGESYQQSQSRFALPESQALSTGHKISASGAILAILFFFMPWVFTSCGGLQIEQSGWDLAAGSMVNMGLSVEKIPGKPVLFLVLVAAFLILVLSYFASRRGMITPLPDGFELIALGTLPLLILFFAFVGMQDEAAQSGVYVEYRFGLWGVVLGYLAAVAGGIINLLEIGTISLNNKAHPD